MPCTATARWPTAKGSGMERRWQMQTRPPSWRQPGTRRSGAALLRCWR